MPFITPSSVRKTPEDPNWMETFSHRPELLDAWIVLLGCIKIRMQPLRYELVTVAAAMALKSSYCALAHGSVLRDHLSDDEILAILRVGPTDPLDREIMAFARAIVLDASAIRAEDTDRLRNAGLEDAEICDIAAAAAARCFFSKYVDALGAEPDAVYAGLPEALRIALTPGRPIAV
ncbi:hypothetical protein QCN27_01400 [Cereibacter sp. SYSU M97828]|nr:hypothetical protein [Cereibacter flavus]